MRIFTALLSLLAAAAVIAAPPPTYRWVDADGIHYSDQPHPGAQQITLTEAPTYSSGQPSSSYVSPTPSRSARDSREGADFRYDSCNIIQPAQDQMLIDVPSANVAVQVLPPKRGTDRVVLSIDGQVIEPKGNDQVEFVISPIDRGTHTVAASVRSAEGKSLCQSAPLTFHVRQPSVNSPANMNRPKPTPH